MILDETLLSYVNTRIAQLSQSQGQPAEVAFSAHILPTNQSISLNPHLVFHPCSTIKTCLLAALFASAAKGNLRITDRITIHNGFPSSMDGSIFETHIDDDSEKTLYARMGQSETLLEIARLMIVRSSNLGTNLLMEAVSPSFVSSYMTGIGCGDLYLRNRMMDMKAFEARQTNRATAHALTQLKVHLARHNLPGSAEMIDILLAQELNEGIPLGLPPGTKVAHQTGSITAYFHDSAIIYPPASPTYALSILTRNIPNEDHAHTLVIDLTRAIHTWTENVSRI